MLERYDTDRKNGLMHTPNQRKMDRYDLKVPAIVSLSDKNAPESGTKWELTIKDICSGGAFLMTDDLFPLETKVDVGFQLVLNEGSDGGVQKSDIRVSGLVIRTNADGMAIKFDKKYQIAIVD